MATDSTNVPQTEASTGNDHQEFNPENIQLAQANTGGEQPAAGAAPQADIPGVPNGSVNVAFPDGQNIVRVQVAPGETISIPFDGDLAAKFGEEGNLAIKVGDRTIILQGYAEANQEAGVTLKDESGDDIDVASVIAATDPNLDIQTAAGGAAGGSAGGSGFFSPFSNAGGLGGLGELGVLGGTELQYGLIQPDANIQLQADTDPTLVSITFDITGGFVNEDDLGGGAPQSERAAFDFGGGHDIGGDLLARLGQHVGEGFWTGGWRDGNDAFDTDDHEAGSQTDSQDGVDGDGKGVHSDNNNGVDQDREPTTAKAAVTVDFHGDVPGKITFSNGANVPVITQLQNQHLTSHGHELQYALLPAANGQGEMIVAYYSEDGINHLVFTIGIEEGSGSASPSTFHVDYTEYDAIDNLGSAADILNVGVPFFMSDSDGSVVAVPSGPNGLNFQIIDDVPELGHVQYGEDGSAQNIVHADLTIGHDESAHSQHTSYQGADGQTHHTDDAGYISADDANNMVKDGLAGNSAVSGLIGSEYFVDGDPAKGFNSSLFLGAARTYIDVSFGADGRAEGNAQAGKTIFAGDGDANSQAFEIYMQGAGATGKPDSGNAADAAQDHAKTNLTIDVDGKEVGVDAYQLDANTIVGIAQDGTPVFTLHLDPETGELTLTQYHQMHNADGSDANDPTNLKGVDAEGNEYDLIHFRGTDYDGDHVDGKLDISFIDDAPKVTCEDVTGKVAESALHDGNRDNQWQTTVATGSLASTVDFGADKDGSFKVNLTDAAKEGLENQHLTSHGQDLQYKVDDNGVLVGYRIDSHGHEHDVFTLEVDANGDFKFTLKDQLDHPGYGQDIKEIDFSGVITATDSDGDSVVLKNGQFEIKVEDDKPVSTCRTVDGTVDESALSDGNREGYWQHASTSGSLKNTVDFGADNHGKFSIDLSQSAKHNLESQHLSSHGQDLHYMVQNGVLVGYTGSENHPHVVFTLTVDSDGDYKFELKDQLDHIGRGNGDVIDIDFSDIIKATDEDGDSIHLNNGQFEVHVRDDQPVSTCRTVDGTVDESALSDGNRDNPWQTKVAYGHLAGTVDFGADNHGKFSIDLSQSAKQSLENQHLTSHGQDLHYMVQNGVLVGYTGSPYNPHVVFTLSVDSDGDYKFELKDQLDHKGPGNDNTIDIDFSGVIKATDEDGDSIHLNNGQFEVHVKDDQPVATCNNVDGTVDESALSDGNREGNWQRTSTMGSLAGTVDFGADNHGKFSIDLAAAQSILGNQNLESHGQDLHYKMVGDTLVGYTGSPYNPHVVFTLTVDENGNYKFELKDQLDHKGPGNDNTIDIDFSGIIKATDEDGDSIHLNNGQFEIHVKDDQPISTCRTVDGTVDESALWDGNRENNGQRSSTTGSLATTVDFGADNHGKFSIDVQAAQSSLGQQHLQSHGQDLHYMMVGDTLVGYTGTANNPHVVFTLTVDSDGDYKFELKDQLDHKGPGNDNTIDIDFSGVIKATDEDGDSIHLNNGQFEIHVKDDQPISTICVADHGGVTIDESAGLQENDKSGPVPSIFNGVANHDAPMGWAQSTGPVVNTTVSFGADDKGSESLTLGISKNGVDSGLTTTDGHHIYLFKEGNLVVGREDGANGKAAFALSMDASGKLTIVQYEPIHQNNPNDPNDAVHIKDGALQVTYTVTDGDGDKDSHTVNIGDTITFKDDGPSKFSVAFSGNDNTVDESALTTANPNDEKVTFHFNYQNNGGVGADGLQSVTFALNNPGLKTASGEVVHTQMVDGVLVGYTGNDPYANHVFTITDNHNGTYTFELDQPLQNNGAQNDQISLNLTATVTDGDGDSQSSNFTIKVNDDTPGTPCVVSHDPNFVFGEGRIDEDYLPTGNHDGDTNPDNVGVGGVIFPGSHYDDMGGTTVGGSVVVDYGADGPGGLSLTSLKVTSDAILGNTLLNVTIDPATHAVNGTNNLKASDGTPIQLVFDGTTLTGYAGNQHDSAHAVFTFTLNANGTWSYTLLQGLDHPIDTSFSLGGLDTRPEDNLHFSFGVTATDKDGDAKTGYVNVNVDDDGPQAGNFTLGTFQEHSATQDLGTVEHVFGGHYTTGADGLGNIQITGGNGAGHGTLTIVNGHVYYTPPANVTGDQSYSFEYTVTDGDGDRDTGKITVGVKDNVPTITHEDPYPQDPNNGGGVLTLSESHLVDGTQPDSNLLSKNGVFTIDTHGEGLGSIQINGNTVTDGSQIPGDKGTLVIDHVTDNHDGTYSVSYHYTVDDNHLLSNPNDTFNQQFNITVKDASGDSASSTITVHVTDDAPIAGAPVVMTVDEDGLDAAHGHNGSAGIEGGPGDIGTVGTHATVALGINFGADGKGSVVIDGSNLPQIKSDGHNVQYELSGDGHTLTGYITYESEGHITKVDVLTLTIDGSNATIDLLAPIDHPDHGQTGSLEDSSTLNFSYTVTDGDGDKASGQINVVVNDDTPTASCVTAEVIKEPVDGGQTGHETYTIDTGHYDVSTGNNTDNTLHISAGYVDANGNYVTSLPGHDGDAASVNVNGDSGNAYGGTTGFGTSSGIDGDGQDRFDEVNYLGDSHSQTSEALVISLAQDGKVATSATVNLAEFYPNEGDIGDEQGAYRLYLNGQPVSDWISFTAENANGSLGLTINGPASGFDQIVFAGLPATANPSGDQNGSDSSDFSIHDATFNVVDADSIGGTVSSAHGDLPLQFGADGPGHVDLTAHETTGLKYNGQDITETVQNGVLYGKAGDTVIYTLTLIHDQNGYHYQFDLAKPIDGSQTGHPITFDYSVTDNDGDKVGGCITINIDDNHGVTVDVPSAAGQTHVYETGLPDGTHEGGSSTVYGSINVDAPDGVTSITVGGVAISLVPGEGTYVQDGDRGLLEITWNQAGHSLDYAYILKNPTTEGSDDKASFDIVVTDPQGDHNVNQSLVITIVDDAPTAQDLNLGTVHEGTGEKVGQVTFEAGADKLQSIEITKGNDGTQGTLTIDTDGTVHYTPPHNVDGNKSYTFEYTVTDKDGDHVTKTITVGVEDGIPTINHNPGSNGGVLTVDEANLPTGTHPSGGTVSQSGTFTVDTHGEGIGTMTITMPGGVPSFQVNFDWLNKGWGNTFQDDNGRLNITGVVHDPVTGKDTFSYTYILDNPHTGENEAGGFMKDYGITVTDGSGDTTQSQIVVHIKDDAPIATNDGFGGVTAQAAAGQDIGNILTNDKSGADGYGSPKIASVVGGVSDGNGGFTIANDKGTIHIAADGKVTFDSNAGHNYGSGETLGFDYTIQDKDGDSSTAHASFTVGNPSTPTAPNVFDLVVHESALPEGSHQGGGWINTGTAFTLPDGFTLDPADIGLHQLPNGTLSVVQSGTTISYAFVLTSPFNDGTTGSSDGQNVVDNANSYTLHLTGPYGQSIDVPVNIDIVDDVPVATADVFGAFQAQTALGQDIGNILTNDKSGADGYASQKITSVTGGVSDGNGGFTITNDKGTIHIAADGKVTFDSNAGHSYGAGEVLGFDYTIKDKDGDTSTAHASFTVGNPATPNAPHASDLLVNESQLPGGTHQGGGSTTNGNSFTVPAGFTAQTGTFNLGYGTLVVTQTGNTISYSYTLTKAVPSSTGSSDGQNTVDNADTHTVHLTGPFGQTIDVTVNVDVKDDVPTAQHADLGSFDENSGVHDIVWAVNFNAGADGLQFVDVTSGNDGSQGTLKIDPNGTVHYTPPTDVNGAHDYTFEYTVIDKDGDKATNTITVHVNDTAKPVLIVGENVDDNSGQQKDHYIDHAPNDQNQGTINGGDAGDVLVGDVGGKSGQISAGDYNICLILDVSTSMNETFAGSNGKSRLDVMQAAVDELLAKYADHPGDVNIKIIAFGTDVVREWTSNANGDFTSTTKDGNQTAIQFVDGLDNRGTQYTNYEAAMAAAKAWFDQVGNNGNSNKAYFLSDGDPTARLDDKGNVVDLNANPSSTKVAQYISEALGAAGTMLGTGNDGLHVDFQAIGIGSGVTKSNLDKFDNSGDTQTPGDAQIVNNASDLNDALDVGKAPVPFDQGNDVINGGKGNDLIFGDEVYTESINDNNPNTIGWQNFGNMTEAQIVAWLKANPDEAGKEYAGAKYGNDILNGGEGDDVIYGQGGDDIITGGTGKDELHGGTGNDTYIWAVGDGNDTIMETAGLKDTLKITGTDTNPTLTKTGNDLIVTIGGETITVKGQFETDNDNNPDTNKAVEFIEVNGVTYRVTLDQNGQPKLTELAPPVNTVPNSVAVNTGTTAIGGVSVADLDSQLLTVTLAVDHGAITLASMAGLTFDAGDGTNDGTMTFHGTQDAINAALAGLKYTSDGNDATLTMTSKDGEGHTDTDQIAIHAVNANLNLSIDHGSYGSIKYTGNDDYSTNQGTDRHIVDASTGGSHTDSGGGHTISAGGGDDWIEAGKGDDDLYGNNGNDYLDGGQGHDTYHGGAGNDVLVVDRDDLTGSSRLIDGGSGDDVLDLSAVGNWDFRGNNYGNSGHLGITNIETLNLNHSGSQTVTLDANSVLDMTDGRQTLVIQGDNNDNVTLNGDWNKVGSVTDHGHTYDVFQSGSGGNLATVIVDQLVHTTTPDHHG